MDEAENEVVEELRNLSDTITKLSSELSFSYLPWSNNSGQILSIQEGIP